MAARPATDFPGTSRKRGPLIAAAAALVVAGAGALAFLTLRPSQPRAETVIAPVAPVEEPAPQASAPPAPLPPTAPPAPPAKVLIEIQTDPPGADVLIDGKTACSPTPCTISAERDALLKLKAELSGYRPSTTELRADEEHKQVTLTLNKRATVSRPSEPGEGELMIPDAFSRPRRR